MKKGCLIILGLLAVGGLISVVGVAKCTHDVGKAIADAPAKMEAEKAAAQESAKSAAIDETVTSQEVIASSGNGLKLKKYEGKRVRWTGIYKGAQVIDNIIGDGSTIIMQVVFPGEYKNPIFDKTSVKLCSGQQEAAAEINEGSTVTFEGTIHCSEIQNELELDNAVIVPTK